MRVTYALSFEDYQFLQPPFRLQAGKNPGFRVLIGFCLFFASFGFVVAAQGLGLVSLFPGATGGEIPVGAFIVALSAAGAAAAYLLDKGSVRRAREKYAANIRAGYARIHCPDQRTLEVNTDGFVATCRCGSVRRPWSELSRYSENDRFFVLGSKHDTHIIPKAAFDSAGTVTELRQIVLEKINSDRPFATPPIEFACKKEDFRRAQALHFLEAGGWRRWLRSFVLISLCIFGLAAIWNPGNSDGQAAFWSGLAGGLFAIIMLLIFLRKRKHYLGPLRMYFSDESLHLQDLTSQGRTRWNQFLGYLEDRNVFLLYYNPRLYRIIPKRVLGPREQEFRNLVITKLARFNYRRPFLAMNLVVPGESRPMA
jgi:hypothetical protein